MLLIAPIWLILLMLPGGAIGLSFWMLVFAASGSRP